MARHLHRNPPLHPLTLWAEAWLSKAESYLGDYLKKKSLLLPTIPEYNNALRGPIAVTRGTWRTKQQMDGISELLNYERKRASILSSVASLKGKQQVFGAWDFIKLLWRSGWVSSRGFSVSQLPPLPLPQLPQPHLWPRHIVTPRKIFLLRECTEHDKSNIGAEGRWY